MNCSECNQSVNQDEYLKINEVIVCIDCYNENESLLTEIIESLTDSFHELDFERIKRIYQQL